MLKVFLKIQESNLSDVKKSHIFLFLVPKNLPSKLHGKLILYRRKNL